MTREEVQPAQPAVHRVVFDIQNAKLDAVAHGRMVVETTARTAGMGGRRRAVYNRSASGLGS